MQFLAEPQFGANRKALLPKNPGDGNGVLKSKVPNWNGQAIWGTSHNTWIKFVVPAPGG
jgi:hypothetical protein